METDFIKHVFLVFNVMKFNFHLLDPDYADCPNFVFCSSADSNPFYSIFISPHFLHFYLIVVDL